jgi:hypothetical protein
MKKVGLGLSALIGFLSIKASSLPGAESAARRVTPEASPGEAELLNENQSV